MPTTTLRRATVSYDEILSTSTAISNLTNNNNDDDDDDINNLNFLTTYLLILFPLYICAIFMNFLSVYSIILAKAYRQYLSNVLLSVICIGALINLHGQIFLILIRWSGTSSSDTLCSSSTYLRDGGFILIHTHILLLACERILAYCKKDPSSIHSSIIQKAHLILIAASFISVILAFTVPIYVLKPSYYSPVSGLCLPSDTPAYKMYLNWIYYGFGQPSAWISTILLILFLTRRSLTSYTSLIPMNRIILIISISSCINLILRTIFDETIGIFNTPDTLDTMKQPSIMMLHWVTFRDLISIVDKILIGILFFIYRPEIRLWLYESVKHFENKQTETMVPQMLDIRSEIDDNFRETDDSMGRYPADI